MCSSILFLEEFENADVFLRLTLISTQAPERGIFWKTLLEPKEFEKASFALSCSGISVVQRIQGTDKKFRRFYWDLINQVVCCISCYRLWQGFGKLRRRARTDSNYCCEL